MTTLNYDQEKTREQWVAERLAEGLQVYYPAPNQLFVDLDSDQAYEDFLILSEMMARNLGLMGMEANVWVEPSRSGLPHRHVRVTLPFNVTPAERIAWQAGLGGDPKHALLSMFRLHKGDQTPTIFVEAADYL